MKRTSEKRGKKKGANRLGCPDVGRSGWLGGKP